MKLDEEKLIGWLLMVHWQWSHEGGANIPTVVLNALRERGWVERDGERVWDGSTQTDLTDRGRALVDLHGPDWGIDTMPCEEEA